MLWVPTLLLTFAHAASHFGLEYNPEDFIVAQPTCVHRLPLTRASREWRGKGIRSFTVLNDSALADQLNADAESREHGDAYGYWEDDSLARGTWRGGNVGDTRAAVTPFLAHQHYGESYKWMLYGDDDTMFYMTGVLKLLAQFDPEQPLAITDNIWYFTLHPSPHAPRCLPCGFNTSSIATNHSFTPRPACPFCTRALACGTYSPRYHCNASHLAHLEATYGPALTSPAPQASAPFGSAAAAGGGGDSGSDGSDAARYRAAMRDTAGRYKDWMARHVALKEKYPREFKFKPAMDWEMRDGPTGDAAAAAGLGLGGDGGASVVESDDSIGKRREQRRRRLQQQQWQQQQQQQQQQWQRRRRRGRSLSAAGKDAEAEVAAGGRRRLAARLRDGPQRYMDGTPWLSAALGNDLATDPAEQEALRLPWPFCARHDERLHTRPAANCLVSISGHGGTGIIFSVGLMRLISAADATRFITTQTGCAGGDCLLGRTLWFRMGVGFTDPGTALQYGAEKYDRFVRFIDSNLQMPQLVTLANPQAVILNRRRGSPRVPACDRSCVWLLENVVGTHVRAQGRQVAPTVEAMLRRLRSHAQVYGWIQAARADPDVQAGRLTVVKYVQAHYGNWTAAARG